MISDPAHHVGDQETGVVVEAVEVGRISQVVVDQEESGSTPVQHHEPDVRGDRGGLAVVLDQRLQAAERGKRVVDPDRDQVSGEFASGEVHLVAIQADARLEGGPDASVQGWRCSPGRCRRRSRRS